MPIIPIPKVQDAFRDGSPIDEGYERGLADDDRFERMQLALRKAAETVQVLILTCRPRDWRGQEVATRLLDRHYGKPLAVALWHAQNEVYAGGARRPYVLVGAHFQRLRATSIDAPSFIYKHLVQACNVWRRDGDGADPNEEAKLRTIKDYVQVPRARSTEHPQAVARAPT